MNDGIQMTPALLGAIIGWTSSIVGLVWWLSRQFSSIRDLVYKRSDMLREKIDSHEKLDEERFTNLGLRMQRMEIMTDTNGRYIPTHRTTPS